MHQSPWTAPFWLLPLTSSLSLPLLSSLLPCALSPPISPLLFCLPFSPLSPLSFLHSPFILGALHHHWLVSSSVLELCGSLPDSLDLPQHGHDPPHCSIEKPQGNCKEQILKPHTKCLSAVNTLHMDLLYKNLHWWTLHDALITGQGLHYQAHASLSFTLVVLFED